MSFSSKPNARLFFGPLSDLVVASIYKFSNDNLVPLGITASLNQINVQGGYANNWTTQTFTEFCGAMQKLYPDAQIVLERDHGGPGYLPESAPPTIQTSSGTREMTESELLELNFQTDIQFGFQSIHVDYCKSADPLEDGVKCLGNLTEYVVANMPHTVSFAVGTDANIGVAETDLKKVSDQLLRFKSASDNVQYMVVNTGSLIMDGKQTGKFDYRAVNQLRDVTAYHGVGIREHNADYLTPTEIEQRVGLIHSLNVAPEMGTTQTQFTLKACVDHGIDATKWKEVCVKSEKWRKWLSDPDNIDQDHLVMLSGHYNFCTPEFENLVERLNTHFDYTQFMVKSLCSVIDRYYQNFVVRGHYL